MELKIVLTDKQEMFCKEYLLDLNATQAAVRAGYSKNTAKEQGSKLLTKVDIREKILKLMDERARDLNLDSKMVVKELRGIGFSNIQNIFDLAEDGTLVLKDILKLPPHIAAAIAEIKTVVTTGENFSTTITTYKMHPKVSALDMLMKHLGGYAADNQQRNVGGKVLIYLPDNNRGDRLLPINGKQNDKHTDRKTE